MLDDKKILTLSGKESIYYSAFTFFSMEYGNIKTKGLLTLFTIMEVFIAQIILITFIGIMAGTLISRLQLKDFKNEKNK